MNSMIKLPTPSSITLWWNFGSLLGLFLSIQILTGVFLAMHYVASLESSFQSIIHIMMDVNNGWLIRYLHANGATFFFIFMYLHISRGIYYKSFHFSMVWCLGVMILFCFMGVAFLGYVLPWGQMSFWGATVITNLISSIPYVGSMIVEWLWGGFSVNEPTLIRFFTLHFIIPIFSSVLVLFHLMFLHFSGSSNPLGLMLNSDKITFHPFFTIKDMMGFIGWGILYMFVCLNFPMMFMDCDNFVKANPMVTPVHIQPEWYFLFAYAILRSIPSKIGGVFFLLMSILIIIFFPLFSSKKMNSMTSIFYQVLSFNQYMLFILLTWIGSLPVAQPYLFTGQILSVLYFVNFIIMFFV